MNCTEAKKINIVGFLREIGINPTRAERNIFWYCSPLRNEETPSFKIDDNKNIWFDHGAGNGGTLIDLVKQMYRVEISEALRIISGNRQTNPSFSFHQQDKESTYFEVDHVQNLQNAALIQYAESRGIPSIIAAKYVKEAYWKNPNWTPGKIKNYFAIAFKNDLGGYELRSLNFKACCKPKTITTINSKTETNTVNIFEGFFDFLSALVHYHTTTSKHTSIIMNGCGFIEKVINLSLNFERINLFLDNDMRGEETANRIQSLRPEAINQAKIIYPKYKDFNDFINNKPTTK